ncbi:hypothetical protein CLIB1423_08S02520 [[Candida] railenensis]|uniref:Zn(2)-C6 fungal-type domain-containing protein n=1 Tax=[Candida] railenensis TaxID=45579 RepID=A0A9P0QQ68_9ASCO|nr:hypothetical protein CLIB1423_08S02520 [[Candida] railenensis]
MFVFPAFDSNYKTRKRTFKCCRTCRTKRMRCIQSENYEAFGCDNCKRNRVECDLIVTTTKDTVIASQTSRSNSKTSSTSSHEKFPGETPIPQWEDGGNLSSPYFIPQIGQQYPIQHQLQQYSQQPQHQSQVSHRHLYHQQPPSQIYEQMNGAPLGLFHPVTVPTHMTPHFQQYPDSQAPYQSSPQLSMTTAHTSTVGPIVTPEAQHLTGQSPAHIGSPLAPPSSYRSSTSPFQLKQRSGMNFQEEYMPDITARNQSPTKKVRRSSLHSVHDTECEGKVNPDLYERGKEKKVEETNLPSKVGGNKDKIEAHVDESKNHSANECGDSSNLPTEPLTANYLKKRFNFNISQHKKRNKNETKVTVRKLLNLNGDKDSRIGKGEAIESETMCTFLLSIKAFTLELDYQTTLELLELYFFKVNSIFPIVQESEFWKDFHNNLVPNIIINAIVLVIARDKSAEKIFIKNNVFEGNNIDKSLQTFFKSLILKIRMLLLVSPELGDNDLLNRSVCQLLLVLHFNFDRFGTDACFNDLTDSINIIKGLYISQRDDYLAELWWISYFFDRIGSIVNTRGLVMKDSLQDKLGLPQNEHLLALVRCTQILYPMAIKTLVPQVDKLDLETTEYIDKELARHEADFLSNFQSAFERNNYTKATKYFLPAIALRKYCTNMTYLIERFCNCLVISLVHKHTLESRLNSKDCTGISDIPLVVSLNTLKYIQYFKTHEDIINISLFPTVLCLGVSIHLRHKFRGAARKSPIPPNVKFVRFMPRWNEKTYKYLDLSTYKLIKELKKFSNKWWFVNEIIAGAISVCQRLNSVEFKEESVGDRRPSPKRMKLDVRQVRERLKIESLLTYDDHNKSTNRNREEESTDDLKTYFNDYVLDTPKFIEDAMATNKEKDFKLLAAFEVENQSELKESSWEEEKLSTLNTIESLALTFFPDDVWKRVNDVSRIVDSE